MKPQRVLASVTVIILGIAALVGITWANYRFSVDRPGGGDFLPRWVGARAFLTDGLNPYSQEVTLDIQTRQYGRPARPGEDQSLFVYPFYSLVFFGPLGLIADYHLARAVWMTVLVISLIALALLSLRLVNWWPSPVKLTLLLLFSILWYPGARNVINGQFAALNAVLIVGALLFILRGEDIAAGIFLALSTIKPHMVFLIIPFVLLWAVSRRRYQLILSMAVSFLGLGLVSFFLLPTWPVDMLRQILAYPSYTELGSPLSIIAGSMPGIDVILSRVLHAVFVLYLLAEWWMAWGKGSHWFLWTAFMTLVVTNLIAYRTATTHYVVLLPVLFLVFRVWEDRWGQPGKWVVGGTLLLLLIGLWVLFLSTVQGNQEQAIVYLPLPFFCLVTLWWVRWWAINPPRLMLEDFASWMKQG